MPDGRHHARRVTWIQQRVSSFEPELNEVVLDDNSRVAYRTLVAAPGIKLDWSSVEGLSEALGRNGVTSNELPRDLLPHLGTGPETRPWHRPVHPAAHAHQMRRGAAEGHVSLVRYLAAARCAQEHRCRVPQCRLELCSCCGLCSSADGVCEKYGIDLRFNSNLVAVDGPAGTATFETRVLTGRSGVSIGGSACCTSSPT